MSHAYAARIACATIAWAGLLASLATPTASAQGVAAPPQPAAAVDPAVSPVRYGAPTDDDGRSARYESAGQALAESAAEPRSLQPTRPASPGRPPARTQAGGQSNNLSLVGVPRVERARVSKGAGRLPNAAGQVWREYDIRPYTARDNRPDSRPQQTIVDWVLRETGYDAWHSETFGILNADRETLTVYHTPAMQAIVADIVDRFVNSRAADWSFSMRIITVRNPDWRTKALGLMTPISVQSPGLQGWVMPKENYALLLSHLAQRSDLREYNAANQVVPNGQATVFSTMRPRGYVKGIVPTANAWPGYQPEQGQLEEGATLEFNPLLTMGLDAAEAVIKIRLQQVERMRPVTLDLPAPAVAGASAGNQRLQIEVPQMTMAKLHERFRWPAGQVLALSMGLVATPGPDQGGTFSGLLPDAMKSPPRADALLFVEARRGAPSTAAPATRVGALPGRGTSFSGRY